MWFIGAEVEQETSAPHPQKKILDPPLSLAVDLPQSTSKLTCARTSECKQTADNSGIWTKLISGY